MTLSSSNSPNLWRGRYRGIRDSRPRCRNTSHGTEYALALFLLPTAYGQSTLPAHWANGTLLGQTSTADAALFAEMLSLPMTGAIRRSI
jgi:hypothetical protein